MMNTREPSALPATLAIGLDLGATKIAAALVSASGDVLAASQAPTEARQGPQAVLQRIAGQIQALVEAAGEHHGSFKILGVGIGSPGQVNSDQGVVRNAVNLGWSEVAVVEEIRQQLPESLPVWIQKDANASALGEYYFGAARGIPDLVYLGVGSGLGAGVISGGRLVTGSSWNPSELGHLSLDPDGLPCNCGLRGCAETIVSGHGLVNLAKEYLAQNRYTSQLDFEWLTSEAIVKAAKLDDELALAALAEVGRSLGMVMAASVAVLNPAAIVLGGGLGLAAFSMLEPAARAELERRVLPASHQNLQIIPSQLKSSAAGQRR